MGWDKLTEDGCWGEFKEGIYSDDELREKGKIFGETFIRKRSEGLMQLLKEAYCRKMALQSSRNYIAQSSPHWYMTQLFPNRVSKNKFFLIVFLIKIYHLLV
ncbi:hypothetical protein [Paenibacillus swuensis]|uniref:hypothetical protein n=1 Tax=Paenibacillus swuensis TaxID=1178515 RepID=UPI0018D30DBD|nr:hypothetical protein [Paenibacillus swuensis]